MSLLLDATTLLTIGLLAFAGWRSRWTGRLVTLLLLSPGLRYVSALFTFPIRLQLSAWAGYLLRLAGISVQTEGNILIKQGTAGPPVEMAVDPACMGLQMTGVSLLVALFLLIWREKQTQKAVPFGWILLYGMASFGLTIICNLFRIVLLVAFGAMPGTAAHEVIGLACVAVYAWLPAWGLAGVLVRRFGRASVPMGRPVWSAAWGVGLLAVGLVSMAFAARTEPSLSAPNRTIANIRNTGNGAHNASGYQCKVLSNGFFQLTKLGVLVYFKPQSDWFSADHSPATCWRGSGYELRGVRETMVDGHPAYVGELRKTKRSASGQVTSITTLYTAWWFTNGLETTISQLTMRGQMLRGEAGFALVNVTTADKNALGVSCQSLRSLFTSQTLL